MTTFEQIQKGNKWRIETKREEVLHSLTHAIGVLLSIVGLVIIIVHAVQFGNIWHVISFSVFGASLFIVYAVSTLYHTTLAIHHGLPTFGSKKIRVLRILDHSTVYLTIAACYTPFALVGLQGPLGWSLLGIIWGLALIGIILKCTLFEKLRGFCNFLYLLMSWLCVVIIDELFAKLSGLSFVLLLSGGLSYTTGFVFYAWRSLPYNHVIWHLFVLCGSSLHYFSVLNIL